MMEPAEDGNDLDAVLRLGQPWNWLLLSERLVRVSLVVETAVFRDETPEVWFFQDQDMVEQLASWRSGESLGERIHVGRGDGGSNDAHAERLECPRHLLGSDAHRLPASQRDLRE